MIGISKIPLTLSNIKIGSYVQCTTGCDRTDYGIGEITALYSRYNINLTLYTIRIGIEIDFNIVKADGSVEQKKGTIVQLRAGYRDGDNNWVVQTYTQNEDYPTWRNQVIQAGNSPGYFTVEYEEGENTLQTELFLGKNGGALAEKPGSGAAPQYTYLQKNWYYSNSDLMKWKMDAVRNGSLASFYVIYRVNGFRYSFWYDFGNGLSLITTYPIPPSWNPYTTRTIKRNYVPEASGPAGMRLYLNNNRYSTTGAAKGNVGLSAAASRAINRNSKRFLLYS